MRKEYKLVIVLIFLSFLCFVLGGYYIIYHRTQEEALSRDLKKLEGVSLLEKVSLPKTVKGTYLEIENGMLEYIDSLQNQYDLVNGYSNDTTIQSLLSVSNYLESNKDFSEDITYVEDVKEKFNKDIDFLISMCDSSYIDGYIKNFNYSSYYEDLYQEAFSTISSSLEELRSSFSQSKEHMNSTYDTTLSVLNFLTEHANDWKIEGEEIQFSTEELVTQYNSLVTGLQ